MALDDDQDDGIELGEEGGAADLRDKAEMEEEDRQEQSKAPRKKLRRIRRKPLTATKQGKPDLRQKIYVTDELDEKHDEPLLADDPSTSMPHEPAPEAPFPDPMPQDPVSVPSEPAPQAPLPEPVQVPTVPFSFDPAAPAVEGKCPHDTMMVEVPKAGVLARFFKFR